MELIRRLEEPKERIVRLLGTNEQRSLRVLVGVEKLCRLLDDCALLLRLWLRNNKNLEKKKFFFFCVYTSWMLSGTAKRGM